MSTQPKTFVTPEEYLEIERKAERKSEYREGEVFAVAGASRAHNLIAAHAIRLLDETLRGRCSVFPSNMRARVIATGLYAYPDVVVVCGSEQYDEQDVDTLLNPTLIIEIMSPSTEAYDRGRKFEQYRTIPTLAEYVLIDSDRICVNVFTRRPDGKWAITWGMNADDLVTLTSVDCSIRTGDLYERTGLLEAPPT